MVDTQRTIDFLLANLFQDGQPASSVSEQDLRDLIVSFGSGNLEFDTAVFNEYLTAGVAIEVGGGSAPDLATFYNNFKTYAFPSNKMTEGFFQIHIEHDYKNNTDITFHIHWGHNNATPTGNVKWQIEYEVQRGYGVGVFGSTTTVSTTQVAGAQYEHHITDDDDMIIIGSNNLELEPDSIIIGRIFRDPLDVEDTFTESVYLLHIDVHYQKSRHGTLERNRPWTAEGF